MAPGINNIPGPEQSGERFANFVTMTKLGSQTIFVMGAHVLDAPGFDPTNPSTWAATRAIGAVYTATLN